VITFKELTVRVITGTTDGAAGTRSNHAHGLGKTPTKAYIEITPYAADDDADNAAVVSLVAVDSTNITVKSSAASTEFSARIWINDDEGLNVRNYS